MKKTKKFLSLMLVVLMCFSCLIMPTQAATFNDINQSGVFVKQQVTGSTGTCTLASAVMMVRRTAMASGNNNWASITESSMRGTAWLEGSGLWHNFTYAGVSVGHSTISSNRKSTYINLLKTYPQGVVAWNAGNGGQFHAVLLTDYDANTDTFYCSDPAPGTANGRIPLSSSSIVGSGQDGKINNLDRYWYVKSPSITLTSNEPTKIVYPTDGGIYKIASGVGNNMYLDFACTNTNIQIYENCDGHSNPDFVKSQYFKLTHVGDGWYTITNTGNGLAMDVYDWISAPGTNISQYSLHKGDNQLFRFYDAGNGYCYIKSKLGTYVDVQDGNNVSNTNVWAYSFNGSNAQKWKLQSHSHSYSSSVTTQPTCTKTGVKTYTCYCGVSYTETVAKKAHSYTSSVTTQPTCSKEGVRTYKCSCGASYTEKIAMTAHTNKNGDNKCDVCGYIYKAEPTTIIYPTNGGIYKIATGVGDNMYLDFSLSRDKIQIYENCDGHQLPEYIQSQYFKLTHVGDGWYTITNIGNNLLVDVSEESFSPGTTVLQREYHGKDDQLFRFYDAGDGYVCIKSKYDLYLDVIDGVNANHTSVGVFLFNGSSAQKWKLENHIHTYSSSITTQPTCSKEGVETFTCFCGDSYTKTISKTAHIYTSSIGAQSDTSKAVKTYTCSCGDTYTEIAATQSYSSTYKGTTYAIYEGSMPYKEAKEFCEKFGGHLVKVTSQEENDVVHELILALGYSGYTCWINGTDENNEGIWLFDDGKEMPYLNWDEGEPNSHQGNEQDYLAMNGAGKWDDYHGSAFGFVCEFPHEHSYSYKVTKAATCTSSGIKTFTCACGDSHTETIAKTAHNSNTIIPAVAPTCTKTGLTEGKKCSACGTVTVAPKTVAKKAHSYTSSVTTQPTCTKEGVRTYKCYCGASYTETIAKKSHTIVTDKAVSATCTKTGLTEGKKCSACGTVTVAQKTVAALGHKDANGDYKCDNGCGYEYDRPASDTPSDPSKDCSCNCHKGGIAGVFFKIILFFQKLFRTNKVCACGVAHY